MSEFAASDAEIRAHFEAGIRVAEIRTDPFVHFILEDVMPEPVYRAMLANWPGKEIPSEAGHVRQRRLHKLTPARMQAYPPELRTFWERMVPHFARMNDLITRKLMPYAGAKFAPFAGRNWRERAGRMPEFSASFEAWLSVDVSDFNLLPHVDHPLLFNNSFFYCPDDDSHPELGTVLYRGLGFMLPENIPIPENMRDKYLREEGQAPFRPNTMMSYLNTSSAFHGVHDISIPGYERRMVMFGRVLEKNYGKRMFGDLV
jgi:hypothetical protein